MEHTHIHISDAQAENRDSVVVYFHMEDGQVIRNEVPSGDNAWGVFASLYGLEWSE